MSQIHKNANYFCVAMVQKPCQTNNFAEYTKVNTNLIRHLTHNSIIIDYGQNFFFF